MERLKLVAAEQAAGGTLAPELQALWFSLAGEEWKSLLLVPAAGARSMPLAKALVEVARASGAQASVLDATGAALPEIAGLGREIAVRRERVIVAVDPVDANPAGLGLAASCDAAVLCVQIGVSALDAARRTIERLPVRFLGCAVLSR
jgi:hypothetical protein